MNESERRSGRTLAVGRYDQHFDELLPVETNLSGAAHLARTFGLSEQDSRKLLGQSGLESSAHLTPVKSLSGGQKSRVLFAALAVGRGGNRSRRRRRL